MKILLCVSIATSALFVTSFAEEEDYWRPKIEYTDGDFNSPWKNEALSKLEYRILYLLEADLNCRNALNSLDGQVSPARPGLVRTLDSIDEVLETLYAEAVPHLKSTPNPYLLTMMLYHHGRFVNSAMERWAPTIEALEGVDEHAAHYVQSILKKK